MSLISQRIGCLDCKLRSNCFNYLSDEELKLIDDNRVEVKFKKGETICKQGSFASHILYLQNGLVKTYLEGSVKNLILNIIPSGHMFGLPSLTGDNIFHYSAHAYVESTVCLIDIDIFRKVMESNPKFGFEILNLVNESVIQSYDRLYSLNQKHLQGKLADILICLADRIYKKDQFELTLSRKDLAEITSMSIESVARNIKDFKEQGIIRVEGRKINILDKNKLEYISENG